MRVAMPRAFLFVRVAIFWLLKIAKELYSLLVIECCERTRRAHERRKSCQTLRYLIEAAATQSDFMSREKMMQKISPFLWFDNQAEEAVTFYTSVFKNSKIGKMTRYGEAGPGPAGSVMVAEFELEGLHFTALNGGPMFKFTEAISMSIDCKDQAEVDYPWNRLSEGGQPGQCGWLKDKFGLSWQVVPEALPRLLGDADPAKASRVMQAMLQMTKIEVAKLEAAYAG